CYDGRPCELRSDLHPHRESPHVRETPRPGPVRARSGCRVVRECPARGGGPEEGPAEGRPAEEGTARRQTARPAGPVQGAGPAPRVEEGGRDPEPRRGRLDGGRPPPTGVAHAGPAREGGLRR